VHLDAAFGSVMNVRVLRRLDASPAREEMT
jgi:hypothetical protein